MNFLSQALFNHFIFFCFHIVANMHLPKKLIDIIAFFKAYNVPLQLVFIPLAAGNLPAYFQSKVCLKHNIFCFDFYYLF